MKILSEIAEEVIYQSKRKVVGVKCECCDKILPVPEGERGTPYFLVRYNHASQYYEAFDEEVCPDCIEGIMTDWLDDAAGTSKFISIYAKRLYKDSFVYVNQG